MGLDNPSPLELSRWLPRDLLAYCRSVDNESHIPATDNNVRSCGGHDLYEHAHRPVHSSPGRLLGGLAKTSASVRRNLFANRPSSAGLNRHSSDLFAHGGGTFMFPDFSLPAVSEAEFEDTFSHVLLASESAATHISPHSLL